MSGLVIFYYNVLVGSQYKDIALVILIEGAVFLIGYSNHYLFNICIVSEFVEDNICIICEWWRKMFLGYFPN